MNGATMLVAMSVAPLGSCQDGLRDEGVDLVLVVRARNERDRHRDQGADQPVTQLQQMGDQRAFG
jgi:hypothetical protein